MNKVSLNWKDREKGLWTLVTPLFQIQIFENGNIYEIWNPKFLSERIGMENFPTLEQAQIAAQEETLKILNECINLIQP